MKHIIIIFSLFSILVKLKSQEIIVIDLTYETVNEINSSNDTLLCNIIFPNPREEISEHIFPYATLQSRQSQDLPQWYINETKRRMKEQNVQNDYRIDNHYAIFKNNGLIEVKKLETFIEYIYSEGCDIDRFVIVKNLATKNFDDLICVFSSNIITKESKSTYIVIKDSTESYLKPNKSYIVENYKIDYTASLCENHFSFKGYGTQNLTYFNAELSVKDRKNNISQILFKVPHLNILGLKSILITDFNKDGKDDIILTVIEELCLYNLIFLTSTKNKNIFDYVGYSKECDCP